MIFTVGGVKVIIGDEVVTYDEVTVETLKELAKERGIKKFTVLRDDKELSTGDFPVTGGTLEIKPYYEAK